MKRKEYPIKSFKLGWGPGSISVSAQSEESGEIVMFPSISASFILKTNKGTGGDFTTLVKYIDSVNIKKVFCLEKSVLFTPFPRKFDPRKGLH